MDVRTSDVQAADLPGLVLIHFPKKEVVYYGSTLLPAPAGYKGKTFGPVFKTFTEILTF